MDTLTRYLGRVAARTGPKVGNPWGSAPLFRWAPGDDPTAVGALSPGFWAARNTSATQIDATGKLVTVPGSTLRDGHYIGGKRYLLLEGQRTNTILNSGTMSGFNPFQGGGGTVVISQNATTAPDGTGRAAAIQCTGAGTGQHGVDLPTSGTVNDNANQPVSVFVKAGTKSWAYFQTNRKDGTYPRTWFHLSGAGSVGTTDPAHTPRIVALGGGWYRVSVVVNSMSGAGGFGPRILPADSDGVSDSTDAVNDIPLYVWGPQHEPNTGFVSSFIETGASSVTRAQDFASWSDPAMQPLSLYCDAIFLCAASGGAFPFIGVGANTPGVWAGVNSQFPTFFAESGGDFEYVENSDTVAFGDRLEIGLNYIRTNNQGNVRWIRNGGAENIGATRPVGDMGSFSGGLRLGGSSQDFAIAVSKAVLVTDPAATLLSMRGL